MVNGDVWNIDVVVIGIDCIYMFFYYVFEFVECVIIIFYVIFYECGIMVVVFFFECFLEIFSVFVMEYFIGIF